MTKKEKSLQMQRIVNIKLILLISSFYLFILIIDKNGLTDGRRLIHRDRSILTCSSLFLNNDKHTMVGDNINTMKTTEDFNFDLHYTVSR